MRAAAVALLGAALFLGGVLVGAAGTAGGSSPLPAPVVLVNDGPAGSDSDEVEGVNEGPMAVEEVEHEVEGHGLEYYEDEEDDSGPGDGGDSDEADTEREDEAEGPEDDDSSGPGSDDSGSGSDSSGSGSSGSGSGSSGSGSGSSG